MGLFTEPLQKLNFYRENARKRGLLLEYMYDPAAAWPQSRSLVLQEDTAVELGGEKGSLFMVLWTKELDMLCRDSISIVGPKLMDIVPAKMPFAQIILVGGEFEDEYNTYRDIMDVIFDTRLEGVSTRLWPDRQRIWCRLSNEAVEEGFDLFRYGSALLQNFKSHSWIQSAEVIFVTTAEDLEALLPEAAKVQNILEAMQKMYEEMIFDCETCDYREVCEEVESLQEIRQKLLKERGQA